jgi:hypothetical protein
MSAEKFLIAWTDGTTTQTQASMEELGIIPGTFTRRSLAADEWPLTIVAGHSDAKVIPFRSVVTIWRLVVGAEEPVKVFVGEAQETREDWSRDTGSFQKVTIKGPWHQLERSEYHQGDYEIGPGSTPASTLPGDVPLGAALSVSWLFLKDYVDRWLSGWLTFPTFAATGLPDVYETHVQGLQANSISSNLAVLLATFPRAGTRFDYSGATPVLEVANYDDDPQTLASSDLISVTDIGLNDEMPKAVTIRQTYPWGIYGSSVVPTEIDPYIGEHCSSGFEKSVKVVVYPPGSAFGGPNVVNINVPVQFMGDVFVEAAEFCYNFLSQRYYSGSLLCDHFQADIQPGTTLSIAGTKFASAHLTVQSTSYDPAKDETLIQFGTQPALQNMRILEILKAWFRTRNRSSGNIAFPPSLTLTLP